MGRRMILDHLRNATLYRSLHPRLQTALDYLLGNDLPQLPEGKHLVDGEQVFAIVQEYETKPIHQGRWEAHRVYTDVQVVVAGVERIGYTSPDRVIVMDPYNATDDIGFYVGQGQFAELSAGMFMILMPHDVHMPQLAVGTPGRVRKIVMKVALGL